MNRRKTRDCGRCMLKIQKTLCWALTPVVALLLASGCTQKANTSSTNVTLNFGAMRAAQNSTLTFTPDSTNIQRLMLNISASDFTTQLQVWNRNGATDTPPASFSAAVPQGSNRLVQVLAIFIDPSTGGMVFYYGDQTASISGATAEVDISLLSIGTGNGQGLVGGRYVNADQSGPTGIVNMMFAPTGKPAMTVSTMEIFNGWFNFTVLQSGSFSYLMQDGTALFQNINATSPGLGSTANPQNWMNVYIPPYYNSNDGGTRQLQANQYWNVGFFGPGAVAANKVCYLNSNGTFTDRNMTQTGSTYWPWHGAGVPTHDDSNSSEAGVMFGGQGVTSLTSGCGTTLFSDYIVLNSASLSQDSALGFRGPFQPVSSQTYLQTSETAGSITLNWKYLPNMSGIDGVVIYSRIATGSESQSDYKADNGFNCSSMPSDFIASNLISYPAVTTTLTPSSFGAGVSASQVTAAFVAQTAEIVVCPYSSATNTYFSSGLDNNSGGGNGGGQATQIVAQNIFGSDGSSTAASVGVATCYPVQLVAETASGTPGSIQNSLSLAITTTDATNETIYSDPSCVTSLTSPISGFMGNQTIYLLASAAAPTTPTQAVTVSASGTGWTTSTSKFYFSVRATSTVNHAQYFGLSTVSQYQCFPIILALVDSASGILSTTTESSHHIDMSSIPTNLSYYSDPNCNTPMNSSPLMDINFNGSTSTQSYFARYGGAPITSQATVNITPTSTFTFPVVSDALTINPPGAPAKAGVQMMNSFSALTCQMVSVGLYDSQGHNTASTSAQTVTLSASAGAFYDSSSCSNVITSISVPAASMNASVYYMASTQNPSISLGATFAGTTSPTSLNVTAALANQMSAFTTPTTPYGACSPVLVQVGAGPGFNSPIATIPIGTTNFTFNTSGNPSTYFADATCGGSPLTGGSIAPNQTQTLVYMFNNNSTPGTNFYITPSESSSPYAEGVLSATTAAAGATVSTPDHIDILGAFQFPGTYCQGFAAVLVDIHDYAVAPAASTTMGIQLSVPPGDATIYTDPLCNSPLGSGSLSMAASTQSAVMFYVQSAAVSTANSFNLTVIGTGSPTPLPNSQALITLQINP